MKSSPPSALVGWARSTAHTNTRLHRAVANKVADSQFSERFTREARAIAALNHANICHLYGVGPNYLVMEYVEGADLRGPLDFEDALSFSK